MASMVTRGDGRSPGRARAAVPAGKAMPALSYAATATLSLALSVIAYWHVWTAGGHRLVGLAESDPSQNIGLLSWTSFALGHGHDPLYTRWINAPYGVNLVDNVGMQLLGVVAIPFRSAFGPVVAYNVLLTLAAPLSALAAFALIRRHVRWPPAAIAGALVYAYSPYMVGQGLDHLHLVFVPLPPLILLVLDDLAFHRQRSPVLLGLLLAGLVVAQAFVSTEILSFTLLMCVVAGVATGILAGATRRRALLDPGPSPADPGIVETTGRRLLIGLAVAAALASLALAYPAWVGFAGPSHITGPAQLAPQQYRADLLAAVVPDAKELLDPSQFNHLSSRFLGGNSTENGTYLGIPLILVVLGLGTLCWRRLVVRVALACALAAFVFSLGSRLVVSGPPQAIAVAGVPLPAALLWRLPILKDALPARLALFVALFAGIVLAAGLERLALGSLPPGRTHHAATQARIPGLAAAGLVAAVALVPLIPAWPYAASRPPIPSFFTSRALRQIPAGATALVYPYPSFGVDDALPMLWQAAAGYRFSMVGGYAQVPEAGTGTATTERANQLGPLLDGLYTGTPPARSRVLRATLRSEMHALGVTVIIDVPTGVDPRQATSFLTWLAGRPAEVSGGVLLWTRCCDSR